MNGEVSYLSPETHAFEEPRGAPMMRHKRVGRKQVVGKSKPKGPVTISIDLSPVSRRRPKAVSKASEDASVDVEKDPIPNGLCYCFQLLGGELEYLLLEGIFASEHEILSESVT